MTKQSIDLVREFHIAFSHPVATSLSPGDQKLRRLRVMLIAEELGELAQALGVKFRLSVEPAKASDDPKRTMNNMTKSLWMAPTEECYPDDKVDIVEAADALGDLDYVVQGGNLVFGVPAWAVMLEIHGANMSKLDDSGKPIYDENGKVVKSNRYQPPNVRNILRVHGR